MSTLTASPALPTRVRLRYLVQTIRWAPAPRFEGTAAARARYVTYLVGSALAWVAIGVGVSALLGALVGAL